MVRTARCAIINHKNDSEGEQFEMSKVSAYLQGHISGEVSTRGDERSKVMHDQSILEQKPDMVVYPRTTNDLRKLARFSWQLAEKGHVLPLHIRGAGMGTTGASLGRGVTIDTTKHMNAIFEFDTKQRLVRTQPGVQIETLDAALGLHGSAIIPLLDERGTLGGAIGEGVGGIFAGSYGSILGNISQLEVVLDNGDLLQTGSVSKRELNHKKGLQGREGDIYRGIDGILDDHADFIKSMQDAGAIDRSGFPGIFDVRGKNGQFDLTPLFVGSQGSLGLISEMIMKTDFVSKETSYAVVVIENLEDLDEIVSVLRKQDPSILHYYDGNLFREATRQGGNYDWLPSSIDQTKAVLLIGFDDLNEHARKRKLARLEKLDRKLAGTLFVPKSAADDERIVALKDIAAYSLAPLDGVETIAPPVIQGLYIPGERFVDLLKSVRDMSVAAQIPLILEGSALSNVYTLRPFISLHRVTDKQKLLKIIDQMNVLLDGLGGALVGSGAEGRVLSHFVRTSWNEEYAAIVSEIKQVFDPYGIFNPEVKTEVPIKDMLKLTRTDNNFNA